MNFKSTSSLTFIYVFLVNELILKQKQRSEEKRLKLDHSVSSTVCSNFLTLYLYNGFVQQLCYYVAQFRRNYTAELML